MIKAERESMEHVRYFISIVGQLRHVAAHRLDFRRRRRNRNGTAPHALFVGPSRAVESRPRHRTAPVSGDGCIVRGISTILFPNQFGAASDLILERLLETEIFVVLPLEAGFM